MNTQVEEFREYLAAKLAADTTHCGTCTCSGGFAYRMDYYRALLADKPLPPFPAVAEICGLSGCYGAHLEPLACAYPKDHEGPHAWGSLPTFVNGIPVLTAGNE